MPKRGPASAGLTCSRERTVAKMNGRAPVYLALLHHPVHDKHGKVVTTSLTTLDLGDIARSCRTFGVNAFFVVSPVDAMRRLARKVIAHWCAGAGRDYNSHRGDALSLVRLARDLEGVEIEIEADTGKLPELVVTSARGLADPISFEALGNELQHSSDPHLIMMGTGWGLTEEVIARAGKRLEPIAGADDYNHLSVRAATAIVLDRLLGTR